MSPFKVVYEVHPLGPMDLVSRSLDQKPNADAKERVAEIRKINELRLKNPTCPPSLSQQAQEKGSVSTGRSRLDTFKERKISKVSLCQEQMVNLKSWNALMTMLRRLIYQEIIEL